MNLDSPFPVDDVTLAAVEHALGGAYTVGADGAHSVVGADFMLPQLLEFLSGYDPAAVVPLNDDGTITEYVGGAIYTEHCVIRALIAEVRRLRDNTGDTPMDRLTDQTTADIRTLMAKLLGPTYPTNAEAEAAFRRLYDALPPALFRARK